MGLTKLSINRPLTMLMIILALVVFGARAFTELQVDRYPSMDLSVVSVVTIYPGASPEDVEANVVKPIEDAVAGIGGIDTIASRSQENAGVVIIKFDDDVDGNEAAGDVERKIAAMKSTLPDGAEEPSILKADIDATPIMELVLSGTQGQDALYKLALDDIQPRLQSVKGVASVSISGGRDQQILIDADPVRLAAYNVPLEGIQQMVAYSNMSIPSGSMDEGRQKTAVRSIGEYTSVDQIENTIIAQLPIVDEAPGGMNTGGNIYLKDIATVYDDYADADVMMRYNGEESVNLSIVKTSDANTVELAKELRAVVEELNTELPGDAGMEIVTDDSTFTQNSIDAVLEDMTLAVLITGLIILLFLHNFRSTLIVLFAIPVTLISTFAVMWALGFSLNVLTLLALTLTIGILVDDSIVAIENIERHLRMGKSPKEAALEGRTEIALAAITISLVDVAVYVPVAFSSGMIGQFFRSYGLTIVAAVLFSLFVSFTLTPMLASLWLNAHDTEDEHGGKPKRPTSLPGWLAYPFTWTWHMVSVIWEGMFAALGRAYAAVIRVALKNAVTQGLVIIIAVGATIGGGMMIMSGVVGSELMPQEDDGKFTVALELPAGTNLAATDEAARMAEQFVLDNVPETVSILTNVGGASGNALTGSSAGSNKATLTVLVTDKALRQRSTTDIVATLRPVMQQIPEATVSLELSSFTQGMGTGVDLRVFGDDPNQLIALANEVEAVIGTVPGTVDIINNGAAQSPEAQLVIDRDRVINQGLVPAQVGMTLRTALNGATIGTFNDPSGEDVDIILRIDPDAREDVASLLEIPVGYNNLQPVKLSQVASLQRELSPAVINRTDRQRSLDLTTGVAGRASGDVKNDIAAAIDAQVDFPDGYGYSFSTTSEIQDEAFTTLSQSLLLGIVFMYMLMVALFQSWVHPITIMMSLPVATVGAFGGLYLFDHTLNIISLLGLILLAGIVTKNAILLVDFTNDLRREKDMACKEALIEAARLRLRPILMTTFALIFAMLPILLGQGAGAEVRSPLAAVVIGGNITSTLLTLILVPVIYNTFDSIGVFFGRITGKLTGKTAQPATGAETA